MLAYSIFVLYVLLESMEDFSKKNSSLLFGIAILLKKERDKQKERQWLCASFGMYLECCLWA